MYLLVYNSPIFPSSNNKCCPTAGTKTMYKLQKTVKFYTQNFIFFLRTSSKRSQQSFFPLLPIHFHWKILSVPRLFESCSVDCSLANHDMEDLIVMQARLIARKALPGYLTVSDKRNIKSVFKYSLGQEKERCNNAQQSFASALRY